MDVFVGLETLTTPSSPCTVAIGTFDGVHLGHQAIIRTAVQDAKLYGRSAVVFTFDRHPAELLRPDAIPGYLTTPEQRIQQISALGADSLVIARFDLGLSAMSADAFIATILIEKLNARAIVVGDNFVFGNGRAGDIALLQRRQQQYGYTLHALSPVVVDGAPASSTRIREALREGSVELAEAMLGHAYWLSGHVVKGQQLGRTLGYPTANLELDYAQVVPADGIYAAYVRLEDGRNLRGACSIGNRPTVEGAGRSIETFLFDFSEDIYGRPFELRCFRRLREEEKFDSLDALKVQMALDVEQARQVLD